MASNFSATAEFLLETFNRSNSSADWYQAPTLLIGSSGKHAAQIQQGLAIDLFLSADTLRPERLAQKSVKIEKTRTTYAVGRLVFWSPSMPESLSLRQRLSRANKISIANARHAPYGQAALQTLESLGIELAKQRLISGENIAHAFQFVHTNHVSGGFVARSQVLHLPAEQWRLVPSHLHQPIEQQMVLLSDDVVARQFYEFIKSEEGMAIIRKHGYDMP